MSPIGDPERLADQRVPVRQVRAQQLPGAAEMRRDLLPAVLASGDAPGRAAIFENGLATLRDLYAQGIADSSLGVSSPGSALAFELARQGGGFAQRPVHSMEDALTVLRVSKSSATYRSDLNSETSDTQTFY